MRKYIREGWNLTPPRRIAAAYLEERTADASGEFPRKEPHAWSSKQTQLVLKSEMYNADLDSDGRQTLKHSPWTNTGLQFDNDVYVGPLFGYGPIRSTKQTVKGTEGDPLLSHDGKVVANMGNAGGTMGTHIWFHHHCSYTGEWLEDKPHGRGRFVHGLFLKAEGIALSPPFIWEGKWSHGKRTDDEGWLGQFNHNVSSSPASRGNAAWAQFNPLDPNGHQLGEPITGVTWTKGTWPEDGSFTASATPAAGAAAGAAGRGSGAGGERRRRGAAPAGERRRRGACAPAPPGVDYTAVLARSEQLANRVMAQLDGRQRRARRLGLVAARGGARRAAGCGAARKVPGGRGAREGDRRERRDQGQDGAPRGELRNAARVQGLFRDHGPAPPGAGRRRRSVRPKACLRPEHLEPAPWRGGPAGRQAQVRPDRAGQGVQRRLPAPVHDGGRRRPGGRRGPGAHEAPVRAHPRHHRQEPQRLQVDAQTHHARAAALGGEPARRQRRDRGLDDRVPTRRQRYRESLDKFSATPRRSARSTTTRSWNRP